MAAERPVVWVGSSRRDLRQFPRQVRRDVGRAFYAAQEGETDPATKPMRGFGGGSIVEPGGTATLRLRNIAARGDCWASRGRGNERGRLSVIWA